LSRPADFKSAIQQIANLRYEDRGIHPILTSAGFEQIEDHFPGNHHKGTRVFLRRRIWAAAGSALRASRPQGPGIASEIEMDVKTAYQWLSIAGQGIWRQPVAN
jgi:hypothetical protein